MTRSATMKRGPVAAPAAAALAAAVLLAVPSAGHA